MMQAESLAAAALVAEAAAQFPQIAEVLPSWVRAELPAVQPALQWAGGGKPSNYAAAQRTTIFADVGRPAAKSYFLPQVELSLDATALFPQAKPDGDRTALITKLTAALQAAPAENPRHWLLTAYEALRRYGHALPSRSAASVSLFDLGRSAAALAPCIAHDGACLISGDISGVQDFIYTITSRRAASSLRGRSLYLQLLTETLAGYVLDQLELPETSKLYAGGGHFYVLARPTDGARLADIQRTVSHALLKQHGGRIYLALGSAEFAPADFQSPQKFNQRWQATSESTSIAKQRRFSELGDKMMDALFTPRDLGGDHTNECAICHYTGDDPLPKMEGDDIEEDRHVCVFCTSLIALGKQARTVAYLKETTHTPQPAQNRSWEALLGQFGRSFTLHNEQIHAISASSDSRLLALTDLAYRSAKGVTALPLQTRYLVNVTPKLKTADIAILKRDAEFAALKPNDVKPFDLMAQVSDGIDRWGVLRMDMDNLGTLFSHGFATNNTLARTAALSHAITLFFEGWVAQICAIIDGGNDLIYSIYSGGDDLFIVGAWHLLPDLAHSIQQQLVAYTAHHPTLTISAGITLHPIKYPLYRAAADAEGALDQAKDAGKNRWTLFGRTFPWTTYDDVVRDRETLQSLGKASTPVLRRLLNLDALYQKHQIELAQAGFPDKTYWGRGQWLAAYSLARMEQERQYRDQHTTIEAIRQSLQGENFGHIHQLGIAARWAELLKRNTSEVANEQT